MNDTKPKECVVSTCTNVFYVPSNETHMCTQCPECTDKTKLHGALHAHGIVSGEGISPGRRLLSNKMDGRVLCEANASEAWALVHTLSDTGEFTKYHCEVICRKSGATGGFSAQWFYNVPLPAMKSDAVINAIYHITGGAWEINHVRTITQIQEG